MTATSSVSTTGNSYIDSLLSGTKWAANSLTYSFPSDSSLYVGIYGSSYGTEPTNNFKPFTTVQQAAVTSILNMYSTVINVTFGQITETSTQTATLRYAESDAALPTAYTYMPSTSPQGGDAWFGNSSHYYDNPVLGNYAWFSMIHETGHALGLKHPFQISGSFGIMPVDHDSVEYTVMTYYSYVGSTSSSYTNASDSYPQSLMMYDIAALQAMYGPNYTTNSGDTVYSWSPTTGQEYINGVAQGMPAGNKVFLTIWDGSGNDTYDFSNYTTNLTVNLEPGQWTTVSSTQLANLGSGHYAAGNIANALEYNNDPRSLIENAIGGSGNDNITGNDSNNTLTGGGGNDYIDGVSGTNTAVYSGASNNYQEVHNSDGTWTITDLRPGSPDGTDTLVNIEYLKFSDGTFALGSTVVAPTIASFSPDSGVTGDGITNASVLTLSGTAETNSTVTVYDGSTTLGTTAADASGNWSYTTGTLSSGSHSFTATDTVSGTTSPASTALSVTVDTTAPTAPGIASFSTDSGVLGDGITNDSTLTLSGTAEANSTVKVYDGSTLLGSAAANGSGAWTYTTSALADGAHSLTATATDVAGNTGAASTALSITVDTTAPTAPGIASFSTDSGVLGDGITNDSTLTLSGTAEANSTVKVYDGSTLLGSAAANGSGAWTYTTSALADGAHSLTATATDVAGNTGAASTALSVTVDTTAPTAPGIASFSTDSGVLGDGITNDSTLTLSGTAEANSTVKVYDGSTLLGSAAANGSGAWTYTTSALADGAHSLTATATDVAGNTGAASTALSITVDTTAPTAPGIASFSTDSGVLGDGITNDSTLTLSGTAEANSTVKVYDGSTLLGSAAANGSGAWTYTTSALADGAHSLTATATDVAGNTGAASTALSVTVDTTAPTAPGIASFSTDSGVLGDGITNDSTLTLSGTAEANSTVKVYDGSTLLGSAAANGSGAWTYTTSALADGAHSLTATATDVAGNTGAASTALSVTVDTTAPTAPGIASFSTDSGVLGDGITNDSTLTLSGTAEANSTVKVYDGSTLLGSAAANGSGAWTYTTSALADGAHSLTATATDVAGNTGAASTALSVTVDTTAPTAPGIASFSTDSGVLGDGITNDSTLTLSGTAEANSTVKVYDGSTLLGSAAANGSGAWTYTTSALANGAHSLTATATDVAGNTGAASTALSVTVDTTAPTAPAIGSNSLSGNIETLSGTAEANSTVKVYDGSTLLGSAAANGSGAWTYTTSALADGAHSLTATATDVAGNTGSASPAVNVTINTTAPTIASFSPDSGVTGDGITNASVLTLSGTAETNSTVTVYDGSTTLGTTAADASGNWSYTTGTLSSGSHSFTATDTVSGTTSPASTALSVTVDTTAPTAPGIASFSTDSGVLGDGITNDSTLTLSGTAEANSTVKVYDGSTLLGSAAANGSGAWTYTTSALADGAHSLTATATDVAGNTGAASTALSVTVDTTAPTAPGIASFSTDSGVLGDGITNDSTLTLSGTAEANSTVKVYDGSTLLGSAAANGSGAWTYTTSALANGAHSLTATATDVAGNTGAASTALSVTVDTTAPTAPAIGSNSLSGNIETLSGTAEANSTVNVYDGSTLLGSAAANGSGAWTYTTSALANGAHSLTATATDVAGNTGSASPAVNVTINTTAPTIASFSPDSGATGDGITNNSVLTLSGTAETNSTVTVYDGSTTLGTTAADASGNWSYTTGTLSSGSHSFTATDTVSGTTSPASTALSVTVDTTAPTAPGIASFSTDSGVLGDGITNDSTLTLSGTAEANSTVKVYDGSTLLGSAAANGSGAWTYTTSALADGAHSLTATATDVAGNTGAASTALSVTVDTTAPTAPGIASFSTDSGVLGDGITNDSTLTLSGTAEANSTVKVYDGSTLLGSAAANGSGAWTYTTSALADGAHSLTATATDVAGNTGAASTALSVTVDTTAPTAPGIASFSTDSGVLGDGITNDSTLTLSGTAEANSTVKVYDGSTLLGSAAANGSGAWTYTTSALADGAHSLTATATDVAGNTGAASTALSITVDTTAPTAPGIASFSTDSGVLGDGITNDSTLTLSGTAEANSTVKVYDGSTLLGSAAANGSGAWTYTTSALADGAHSLTATATDVAGNTGAASTALSVTVDTTAPTAPGIASFSTDSSVLGDGITNDSTLTLSGTAEANSTVKVYDGSTLLGSAAANGSGAWTYTTSALANGAHSLTATATDVAGNTGAASTALSITVDTTAPTAPGIASFSTDSGVLGDGITNDSTLTLSGTAEANSTVKVYDGSTLLGSAAANGSGAWTYTTSALADGAHSLTATATDVAGNTGAASTALSVTVDTTAPTAPAIGSNSLSGNIETLSGTAEANSTINVYDGSTLLGSAITDSSGAWNYAWSLTKGTHSITATAADVAGNMSAASAAVTLTKSSPNHSKFAQNDFNFDGTADVVWRDNATGTAGIWLMSNGQVSQTSTVGSPGSTWQIAGTGDFNNDGTTDILWRDSATGTVGEWLMSNGHGLKGIPLSVSSSNWQILGTGDFNNDGTTDILWRDNDTGTVGEWLMSNGHVLQSDTIGVASTNYKFSGTGDFNNDGTTDILWRDSNTGTVSEWLMSNGQISQYSTLGTELSSWQVVGTGDFNNDGTTDILFRDSNTGAVEESQMSNGQLSQLVYLNTLASNWQFLGTGDFNNDGTTDILLRDSNTGVVNEWLMSSNGQVMQTVAPGGAPSNWNTLAVHS